MRKTGTAAMMLATIAIAKVIKDVTAMEGNSMISSIILDRNLDWWM
jgi:hypothetical protein